MNALLERLPIRTSDAVQSKKILEREIQKHKNRTRYLRCEEYKLMRELDDLRRKAKAAQQREQRHAEKQISEVLRIERKLQERTANRQHVEARRAEDRVGRHRLLHDVQAMKMKMAQARKEEYRKEQETASSQREEELRRKANRARIIQKQHSDAKQQITEVIQKRKDELMKQKRETGRLVASSVVDSIEKLRKAEAMEALELRRLCCLQREVSGAVKHLELSGIVPSAGLRRFIGSACSDILVSSR
ncbi:UNVERIFIED_CONTAM: hypothetical protein HHA_301190 [Hammondia hammondi]|eukprot:XP_008888181.1 hypothetical protein HHA_301190 [Hammondia hammondi]